MKRDFSRFIRFLLLLLLLVCGLSVSATAVSGGASSNVLLKPEDFTLSSGTDLSVGEGEDGGFVFSNKRNITQKTTYKYTAKAQIDIDLDEFPVLTLTMGHCACQYDAFYTLKSTGESHYLNSTDTADWRWSGSYSLNLVELHGWVGEQTIVITFEYILWEIGPAETGEVTVEVSELGFKPVSHFSLSALYGDNMVFQQNAPICVTGTGDSRTELNATLKNADGYSETVETVVGEDGTFTMQFSPLSGGYDAYTLTVTDGKAVTILKNIVIGEVWLAGGQSNMEYRLKWTVEGAEMTDGDATDSYLRCNRFGEGMGWLMGDCLDDIEMSNAVGYYFAQTLRKALDVPVAVIHTARGSTSIYNWLDKDVYTADTALKAFAADSSSEMYDTLVAPLAGFRLRGLIWYQGECNFCDTADTYGRALNLLRDSWGELFGFEAGTMPLIVSHLAPYSYANETVNDLPRFAAELAQAIEEMSGPTTQVTIYDCNPEYETSATGAPVDPIHPSSKTEIGIRLAKAALNLLYTTGNESGAPVFKSFEVKDGALYITFAHVGTGLAVSEGETLHGFCICGKDRVFLPAEAKLISADTVRLTSDYVKEPFGASYGYTDFNLAANLVNTVGNEKYLPAVPFITDNAKTGYIFRIREWLYCDSAEIWRGNYKEAGYEVAWSSENGTVTYSTTDKWGGTAALRLAYTADADGLVSLSPNVNGSLGGSDTGKSYTKYGAMLLHIKSENAPLTLKAICINGKEAPVNATVGTEWTTLNVDISTVKGKADVSSLSLLFVTDANSEGVLLVDEISFGTDADAYSPYTEPEPSATASPTPTAAPTDAPDGQSGLIRILLTVIGCSLLCSLLLLLGTAVYSRKKNAK